MSNLNKFIYERTARGIPISKELIEFSQQAPKKQVSKLARIIHKIRWELL